MLVSRDHMILIILTHAGIGTRARDQGNDEDDGVNYSYIEVGGGQREETMTENSLHLQQNNAYNMY